MSLTVSLQNAGYVHGPSYLWPDQHVIFDSQGGVVGYFTAYQAATRFFPEQVTPNE